MNKRMQLELRESIGRYISRGYQIISRVPIVLQRGRHYVEVRNGAIIGGRTQIEFEHY